MDDKNSISACAYGYLLDFIGKSTPISYEESCAIDDMVQSKRAKRQREKIKLLKTQGKARKVIDIETGQIYRSCNQAAHAKRINLSDLSYSLHAGNKKFNLEFYEEV